MMKKKIVVLDDEPLISVLMKEVIEEDQGLELAQIFSRKNNFLESVSHESFDCALIDISVEGREGGLELLKAMKDRAIYLPAVMISAHDEVHYAIKCLKAGARGYINKRYICTQVVKCLNEVLQGRLFVSGEKGEDILKQYKNLAPILTV